MERNKYRRVTLMNVRIIIKYQNIYNTHTSFIDMNGLAADDVNQGKSSIKNAVLLLLLLFIK